MSRKPYGQVWCLSSQKVSKTPISISKLGLVVHIVIPAVLEEEYRIVIQTGLGKKVRLLYEK
jgi:hypothetical protein